MTQLILGGRIKLSHGLVGAINQENWIIAKTVLPAKFGNNLPCTDPVAGENRSMPREQHYFAVKGSTPGTGKVPQAFQKIQAAVIAGGFWVRQEATRVDAGGTLESINLESGIIRQDSILTILPVSLGFEGGIFKVSFPTLTDIIEKT